MAGAVDIVVVIIIIIICVTHRASVQAIWPRTRDFDHAAEQPHAAKVCRFNGLHHRNPWITRTATHLPIQEGWKAELAWLVDLYSEHFTHKVVTCQP